MFSSKKSPPKSANHSSAVPRNPASASPNPFDSDDEHDYKKHKANRSKMTSSDPKKQLFSSPVDDHKLKETSRNGYKNGFQDSGGLENQSVQELENYAVHKAEETTKSVNNCLRIAEEMRDTGTKTLAMLHEQGEQITRTHRTAADMDHDLSRGEKLLGSLGGIFSKTWKPKKTRDIRGPVVIRDDVLMKGNRHEQRERLGLTPAPKSRTSNSRATASETDSPLEKVEVEKAKQDDALSDLSNILGELKNMALDMGSEIDRHNKSLDPFHDDVEVFVDRVGQANRRARHLLRK